jgi:hypothetical protein
MAQTSFRIEDDIYEWVEDRLLPGQSKSIWYRYAVETVHNVDQHLDTLYEPYQYDERSDFVEAAVKEKIERVRNDANHEKR